MADSSFVLFIGTPRVLFIVILRVEKFHALLILHNPKVLLKERQQLINDRLLLLGPVAASEA